MMMIKQTNIWGFSAIVKCRPCIYQIYIYIFGCSDLKDYAYKFAYGVNQVSTGTGVRMCVCLH